MSTQPTDYVLMTIPQVCEIIGYTRDGFQKLVYEGRFPKPIKIGTAKGSPVRVRSDVLQEWMDGLEGNEPPAAKEQA